VSYNEEENRPSSPMELGNCCGEHPEPVYMHGPIKCDPDEHPFSKILKKHLGE